MRLAKQGLKVGRANFPISCSRLYQIKGQQDWRKEQDINKKEASISRN